MTRVLKWVATGVISLLVLLLGSGAVYQRVATASAFNRYDPPGRMIDMGSYDIHINCTGRGPNVVLESGFGGWSIDWRSVQSRIARFARVCSYDRSGLGWSDRAPSTVTTRAGRARELHALLRRAGIHGPHVLVGHSLGGFFVREFAHRYPKDVAGLVFVDSSHEEMGSRVTKKEREETVGQLRLLRIGRYLMPFGLQRVMRLSVSNESELPADVRAEAKAIGYRSSSYFALYDEASNLLQEESQGKLKLTTIPDVPLAVLASEENIDDVDVWRDLQQELADLTTHSTFKVVEDSGHFIHVNQPTAVVRAIETVTTASRLRG